MLHPLCPICSRPLSAQWRCENGHCFDVARQGYVNLLTVQQKHSLHPGDTAQMVAARRRFLGGGYYRPIAEALQAAVAEYAPNAQTLLDVGCGEGYYLSFLKGIDERWGLDISKDAVRYAAGRDKSAHWLTATAAHLPFSDGTFDCLLSMFALTAAEEFARVLRPQGIFVQVLAGANHLPALKSIIYPERIEKPKELSPLLSGFQLLEHRVLEFSFTLTDAQTVHDLLYMTPHVWRISRQGAQALENTAHLEDRAEVIFNIYSRQAP